MNVADPSCTGPRRRGPNLDPQRLLDPLGMSGPKAADESLNQTRSKGAAAMAGRSGWVLSYQTNWEDGCVVALWFHGQATMLGSTQAATIDLSAASGDTMIIQTAGDRSACAAVAEPARSINGNAIDGRYLQIAVVRDAGDGSGIPALSAWAPFGTGAGDVLSGFEVPEYEAVGDGPLKRRQVALMV